MSATIPAAALAATPADAQAIVSAPIFIPLPGQISETAVPTGPLLPMLKFDHHTNLENCPCFFNDADRYDLVKFLPEFENARLHFVLCRDPKRKETKKYANCEVYCVVYLDPSGQYQYLHFCHNSVRGGICADDKFTKCYETVTAFIESWLQPHGCKYFNQLLPWVEDNEFAQARLAAAKMVSGNLRAGAADRAAIRAASALRAASAARAKNPSLQHRVSRPQVSASASVYHSPPPPSASVSASASDSVYRRPPLPPAASAPVSASDSVSRGPP